MSRPLTRCLVLAAVMLAIQAQAGELLRIHETEHHLLPSRFIDQTYEIFVMVPPGDPKVVVRYPVLYMLDSYGGMKLQEATWSLQNGEVNRYITVGIGYPEVRHPYQASPLRARDLSFVHLEIADALKPLYEGEPVVSGPKSGEGEKLIRFIKEQLIPFIDARYPTVPGDRGLYGFSLAGNFALNLMFREPRLFQRYIVGSPAISFNGDRTTFRSLDQVLEEGTRIPARIFISVGLAEQHQRLYRTPPMDLNLVSNYREMVQKLSMIPGLEVMQHEFQGQPHSSVSAMTYILGAQKVFGFVPCDVGWPKGSGVNCVP